MKSFSILASITLVFVSSRMIHTKDIDYSYSGITGPMFWADLEGSDEICSSGKYQSPIDIPQEEIHKFSKPDYVTFEDAENVEIVNNGHTIQISNKENILPATMKIGNDHYDLAQFHFHTPSEHLVDGKYFDVEVHFVFQTKEGNLSVIGIFYDVSKNQNDFLCPIIDNLPLKKNDSLLIEFIKLSSVLEDIDYMNQAYTYPGSLTTPPCSEGVIWWVNKIVQPISLKQYKQLRDVMGFNSRFPQVINY
ncbi:20164_t:CDS:2 [Funneliformis geosporum]|uniref:Carbonic anhydrase n=1 Tax=Funneliformis geosporum TaxID=1117311 RepID=A0A9W4SY22_9GLOM|nr:20164_t:CDS:2 [Funneliformis geosporum]CAI2183265.1 17437_t:CDS:2 [Funneliformis geosporum]